MTCSRDLGPNGTVGTVYFDPLIHAANIEKEELRKKRKLDRIVQKAEAAQRYAKMGAWR